MALIRNNVFNIYFCDGEYQNGNVAEELHNVNLKLDIIMAKASEIKAQLDELQQVLDAEQQEIADAIARLEQSVADLQALVADGGTEAERQAILDQVIAIKEDLQATISEEPEPPVEPTA